MRIKEEKLGTIKDGYVALSKQEFVQMNKLELLEPGHTTWDTIFTPIELGYKYKDTKCNIGLVDKYNNVMDELQNLYNSGERQQARELSKEVQRIYEQILINTELPIDYVFNRIAFEYNGISFEKVKCTLDDDGKHLVLTCYTHLNDDNDLDGSGIDRIITRNSTANTFSNWLFQLKINTRTMKFDEKQFEPMDTTLIINQMNYMYKDLIDLNRALNNKNFTEAARIAKERINDQYYADCNKYYEDYIKLYTLSVTPSERVDEYIKIVREYAREMLIDVISTIYTLVRVNRTKGKSPKDTMKIVEKHIELGFVSNEGNTYRINKNGVKQIESKITQNANERQVRVYKKETWEQRGFIRRYKSGKEVYINPMTKQRRIGVGESGEGKERLCN